MSVNPSNFDISKITFSKPKACNITTKEKDEKTGKITEQNISYNRLTVNYSGSKDWLFELPECFSFGVQRKVMNGRPKWTVSCVLQDRDGATPEQEAFTTMFDKYVEHVKAHLVEIGADIGSADIDLRDLRGLSPVYMKKDKKTGKIAEDATPTLYPSLNHTVDKVNTDFYTEEDVPVSIDSLVSTDEDKNYFTIIQAALCANGVYIGGKGNMNSKVQCTIEEAVVRQKQRRVNRLLGNGGIRRKWQPPTDGDEDEDIVPIKSSPIKSSPTKSSPKTSPAKSKPVPEKVLEDSDSDEEEKPKASAPRKTGPKAPLKKKAPAKKEKEESDSD
jgi:hypothetical protein